MKPGDHPDFFRFAPPPGTSRESTIALDAQGQFWHDGERVEHRGIAKALASWTSRHPDDGRPILTNGYDWCYFKADDALLFVTHLRLHGADAAVVLADGTEERLHPERWSVDQDGCVWVSVRDGKIDAKLHRHAQAQLVEILVDDDPPTVEWHGRSIVLPPRTH